MINQKTQEYQWCLATWGQQVSTLCTVWSMDEI